MTNVQPQEDWVFVRKDGSWDEEAATTTDLVVVLDRPRVEVGVVLSVGPGEQRKGGRAPMEVGPGDRIIYKEFAGSDFGTIGEKDYLFVKQGEILARVDG